MKSRRDLRQEYTDRFEALTKQEIQRYNDSLLNTHKALEEFRLKLKESVEQYAVQVVQLSSKVKQLELENRNLKAQVKDLSNKIDAKSDEFNQLERSKILKDKELEKSIKSLNDDVESRKEFLRKVIEEYDSQYVMTNRRLKDVFQEMDHSYMKSKEDNIKLKEEILSIPCEAEKVRKELLEKIAISTVDNNGLLKEVAVVKKRAFIQEKMNEYFHIQINRLKSKDSVE